MGTRPPSKRTPAWYALVVAAGLSLGLAFAASGASAATVSDTRPAPVAAGQRYYIDCGSGNDAATGKTGHTAWRTLAKADTVTFQPGDTLLLRSGTSCDGVLSPQGSGTAGHPIVVSAYGRGARPAIVAGGARAAVYLHNVQGWEIRHLDISDQATLDGTPRTGIYVLLNDYGTGRHYVVDDVKVHDVTGCDCTAPDVDPSGGIVFKAAGSTTPTGFDQVRVSDSTVSGVDGMGIGTSSQWSHRPLFPGGENSFVPMSRVRIVGNVLSDLGGDGIVVQNGADPLIEWNKVDGFGLRPTAFHVGVWAWNSDHPVMQFNEASHGAATPIPAPGYDVDGGNSDVVYQYNYSHDNGGGFMLLCAVPGEITKGATVRYNISQDDQDGVVGTYVAPVVGNCYGNTETNLNFYNNVVSTKAALLVEDFGNTAITLRNNVFAGPASGSAITDTVGVYDHNLYSHITAEPSGDRHPVTGEPLFTGPADAGPPAFRLTCGSAAIGAGIAVPGNGGRDFFGFPVPARTPPNLGAYQGPCAP